LMLRSYHLHNRMDVSSQLTIIKRSWTFFPILVCAVKTSTEGIRPSSWGWGLSSTGWVCPAATSTYRFLKPSNGKVFLTLWNEIVILLCPVLSCSVKVAHSPGQWEALVQPQAGLILSQTVHDCHQFDFFSFTLIVSHFSATLWRCTAGHT
jgi:hypothetical protein